MLIKALCDYYDLLAADGKVLPDGRSNVRIHYKICLDEEGRIKELTNAQKKETIIVKGKEKNKIIPAELDMPQRTEKPGIDSNIIEHRPVYIFGLNMVDGKLTPDDRTDKARKSHEAFIKTNLEFIEGLDSPLINAFRKFLLNWKPEDETENDNLLGLGKDYSTSGFVFCLEGYPDRLLQDEEQIKKKWDVFFEEAAKMNDSACLSQCAITGEEAQIARIHDKIKGVYGGLATGSVLIGFNNPSESSYGKEQSYNSNISEKAMKKYTRALNYLLGSSGNKILLDDVTVVFWSMDTSRECEDVIMAMLFGQSDQMDAKETEHMLKDLMTDARKGTIVSERLKSLDSIKDTVDFYMIGLKPNSSRVSVKFVYRRKYAEILWNIVRFQEDLQVTKELHPVSVARIKMELISPKSKNEKVNPELLTKTIEAILYGTRYPFSLLETIVRRVKTDTDVSLNMVRAGLIKACLNRNYNKEEIGVGLNEENTNQAYLCGRLFAVLERLQREASNNTLNRTIKDAYFASAASKPAMVFPKLLALAQNHLKKVKSPGFYNMLIGEIMRNIEDEFPEILGTADQGRFMIGYYQQCFAKSKNEKRENKEEEKNVDSEQI